MNNYIIKDILIEKLNKSIINDYNFICSINIYIKDKKGREIKDKELIDFLKQTKDHKIINFIFKRLFDIFKNKNIFAPFCDDVIKIENKLEISLNFLKIICNIKNIPKCQKKEEMINDIFNVIYKLTCDAACDSCDANSWKNIYHMLINSKNIFFGIYNLNNFNESKAMIFENKKPHKGLYHIDERYYCYRETKELLLTNNHLIYINPLFLETKLIKIWSYIKKYNFDFKQINVYDDLISFEKFCEQYPDILSYRLDSYHLLKNNIAFDFSSIDENYPYCSQDMDLIFMIKDNVKNIMKISKMNLDEFEGEQFDKNKYNAEYNKEFSIDSNT